MHLLWAKHSGLLPLLFRNNLLSIKKYHDRDYVPLFRLPTVHLHRVHSRCSLHACPSLEMKQNHACKAVCVQPSMIIPISKTRTQKPGVVNSVRGYEGGQWRCRGWCPDSNALSCRAYPVLPSARLSCPGCLITHFPLLEEEARGKMQIHGGEEEV